MAFKILVLQPHAQFVFRDLAQDGDGIVKQVLPAARGKFVKEILRLLVPAPPEIAGQFLQPRDQFVQFRNRERFFRHRF